MPTVRQRVPPSPESSTEQSSQPTESVTQTLIDEYEVMYSSNRFHPRIWLKNSGRYIGQLIFMPNGTDLPQDFVNQGTIWLHYHQEDFKNALDLLRNEKPMYLLFLGSGSENGIKTTQEQVGEGES
jgi:hypothetical protein